VQARDELERVLREDVLAPTLEGRAQLDPLYGERSQSRSWSRSHGSGHVHSATSAVLR
jgi:hypothetical protein